MAMTKYCGMVGFADYEETAPGVWTPVVIERRCFGDLTRVNYRNKPTEHLNDDITFDMTLSVLMDSYIQTHAMSVKYITWGGAKWSVSSIQFEPPRVIFSIGGVYNGETTTSRET